MIQWGVVIGASLVAAIVDGRSHRLPNALTLPLVVTGLLFAAWQGGWAGLGDSLAACFVLALPYVLLFLLAGGGAGDAKMMGALGAWLGWHDGIIVLVAVAVVGGLLGLVKILADKRRGTRLGGFFAGIYVFLLMAGSGRKDWSLLRAESPTQGDEENGHRENRHDAGSMMPYGPAIFVGVCIGAVVVQLWQG